MHTYKPITQDDFKSAVATLTHDPYGTVYQPVATTDDGRTLHIVWGYEEGYDADPTLYQHRETDGTVYTICAKLAFNVSSLQADYNWDWYEPWFTTDDNAVYDTSSAVTRKDTTTDSRTAEFYNDDAAYIVELYNDGKLEVD